MSVGHSLEGFRRTDKAYGHAAAFHELAIAAANRVVDLQVLKAMTAHIQDVTDPGLFEAAGYEGHFATANELARYAETQEQEFSADFLRMAFARGDRCYAIFREGKLASHGWYSNRSCSIDAHYDLHFDPAYTYMYKGYTAPEHRGKRLHAVGMCRALRAVTEEGKRGLISYVFSNNFASLRSVHRMGYRIFGTVVALRTGSFDIVHASRGCDAYGFKLVRRSDAEDGVGQVLKAR